MTVGELIWVLSRMPPDAKVLIASECGMNEILTVKRGRYGPNPYGGEQGSWHGPFDDRSPDDRDPDTFEAVELLDDAPPPVPNPS